MPRPAVWGGRTTTLSQGGGSAALGPNPQTLYPLNYLFICIFISKVSNVTRNSSKLSNCYNFDHFDHFFSPKCPHQYFSSFFKKNKIKYVMVAFWEKKMSE
jgi:hypothetical protein